MSDRTKKCYDFKNLWLPKSQDGKPNKPFVNKQKETKKVYPDVELGWKDIPVILKALFSATALDLLEHKNPALFEIAANIKIILIVIGGILTVVLSIGLFSKWF